MTAVVLDDAAIDRHVARVDVDGYTIVDGAIEPDLVDELRTTIRRVARELDLLPRATQAEGHATIRMYNLLTRAPVFQQMPLHPNVLPIVERLLDRGCLLSGMTAVDNVADGLLYCGLSLRERRRRAIAAQASRSVPERRVPGLWKQERLAT